VKVTLSHSSTPASNSLPRAPGCGSSLTGSACGDAAEGAASRERVAGTPHTLRRRSRPGSRSSGPRKPRPSRPNGRLSRLPSSTNRRTPSARPTPLSPRSCRRWPGRSHPARKGSKASGAGGGGPHRGSARSASALPFLLQPPAQHMRTVQRHQIRLVRTAGRGNEITLREASAVSISARSVEEAVLKGCPHRQKSRIPRRRTDIGETAPMAADRVPAEGTYFPAVTMHSS
jgi:hypothetical protein